MSRPAPLLRFGWAGKTAAERAFDGVAESFVPLALPLPGADGPTSNDPVRLWDAVRAGARPRTPTIPRSGPATASRSGRRTRSNTCSAWRSPPVIRKAFGPCSRRSCTPPAGCWSAAGGLGGRAGSLGSWQAEAVRRYGVLRADAGGRARLLRRAGRPLGRRPPGPRPHRAGRVVPRVPGRRRRPPGRCRRPRADVGGGRRRGRQRVPGHGGQRLRVHDAGPAGPATTNAAGVWPHQMCLTAVHDDPRRPWAGVLNSWGERARDGEGFRRRRGVAGTPRCGSGGSAVEEMLRRGEAYAYSRFAGFPPRRLDWGRLIG